MKYHLKSHTTVEAITFEDLVAIGVAQAERLNNGIPWSFYLGDTHVSHENDDCYMVGNERFERGDMLVNAGQGWVVFSSEEFEATYEKSGKYEDSNPLAKLHDGEPYFFLRSQDKCAPSAVLAYAQTLRGAGDEKGYAECRDFAIRMERWQAANPDKVKMPD